MNASEIWRAIPPEEKFELIARAQARGILSAVLCIVVCSTIAIGLKLSYLLWGSLIASPMIFQFATGKTWRRLKPKVILEYLAARSAARRFAFAKKSKDLTITLMFRGRLQERSVTAEAEEAVDAMENASLLTDHWVVLLADCLVVMEEQPGGATLTFGALLDDDRLRLEEVPAESGTRVRAVNLFYEERSGVTRVFTLETRFPAALVVFEKRVAACRQAAKQRSAEMKQLAEESGGFLPT